MNQPIRSAAAPAGGHGPSETQPTADPAADPLRTLMDTVATCRPLDQVTELVSLLKEGGRHPDLVRDAVSTAAVNRPVDEVGRLIGHLCQSPQEQAEAEIALRAAAAGRPIEDVATLVGILAAPTPPVPVPVPVPEPDGREPVGPRPAEEGSVEYDMARLTVRRRAPEAPPAEPPARTPRPEVRWAAGLALLFVAALHLPADPAAVLSGAGDAVVPAVTAVLCVLGALALTVRSAVAAWWGAAATAGAVIVLHLAGRTAGFDPLSGTLGAPVPWAGAAAVLGAAIALILTAAVLRPPARNEVGADRVC
ncbi:hypothetical protein LG634_33420 [Streptomyces bambusae]|uniref:hypothetical protein n=1 Tax=Streptomyces bambusae TaxID=1550616 RepID=UPI001D00142D|nr:hypothetical protein [Streptomyces bambusae]MCB5169687.1 hypothetical protein [Streptomyces bambusae]